MQYYPILSFCLSLMYCVRAVIIFMGHRILAAHGWWHYSTPDLQVLERAVLETFNGVPVLRRPGLKLIFQVFSLQECVGEVQA